MGASFTGFRNWWTIDSDWHWQQQYIILPRRSTSSGKLLWCQRVWHGYRYVLGPAGEEPAKLEKWLTDEEYMWHRLQG